MTHFSVEQKILLLNLLSGTGADPAKSPCKKAKQLRWKRKLEKLKEKGVDVGTLSSTEKNKEKQMEDFINELPKEYQKRLEVHTYITSCVKCFWCSL